MIWVWCEFVDKCKHCHLIFFHEELHSNHQFALINIAEKCNRWTKNIYDHTFFFFEYNYYNETIDMYSEYPKELLKYCIESCTVSAEHIYHNDLDELVKLGPDRDWETYQWFHYNNYIQRKGK